MLGIHGGRRAWKRAFTPGPMVIKTSDSFGKPNLKRKTLMLLEKYTYWATISASGLCILTQRCKAESLSFTWRCTLVIWQDVCGCLKNILLIVSDILLTSNPRFFRVVLYVFVLVPVLFFNLNRSVPSWCLSLRRTILALLSLPFAQLNKSHPSTISHYLCSPILLSP